MFKLLGVLLALYTLYAVLLGQVYAKERAWGRHFQRNREPRMFWAIIAIYSGLSLALITVF